jgi:hypothetical protein
MRGMQSWNARAALHVSHPQLPASLLKDDFVSAVHKAQVFG